jgi:site-specific DNA-cytosine methylase
LSSSRDTLDLYFTKIYKDIVIKKKNKIFIKLENLNNINQEMKMRVFKKSIKDFTNSYYSPRSKKIFNLISQIKAKKNAKLTLGGCIILREKKHITLMKEIKN